MRPAFTTTLALVLMLSFAAPAARAQEDKPPPESEDEPKPYVSPPAWKSVEIADFYLKTKKYRAALGRYQEAAKMDPYYPQTYLGLGKVYEKIGLRQKALENYRRYLDLLPSAKQAEEAREVHKAIERLERQVRHSKNVRSPQASGGKGGSPLY